LPENSILITANMQSETGFPSSHQLKSYVAYKSRLKLAARAVLSADAGLLVVTIYLSVFLSILCLWFLVMAGRRLYFRPVVSFFYLLFTLVYSQSSQIGCVPYFYTWCSLIANLGYRSETCCTRLAEKYRMQKSPKICHLCTTAQLCRLYLHN